jgi:hypothetical protein
MFADNESRRAPFSHASLLAAAFFGFLLGSGYAVSTHIDGAAQESRIAIPAVPATDAPDYFPAQYVNQAKDAGEDIATF